MYSFLIFQFIDKLYYLNSSIICCIFSGDIYLSLGISVSSKLFCGDFLVTPVILSAILLPIKSPVASAVIYLFEAFFIVEDFLA